MRIASMATAAAKKIELEADSSCYSFDVLCNVAKLHNSSCDSINTAEIEQRFTTPVVSRYTLGSLQRLR